MTNVLSNLRDSLFRRRDAALSIPILDGALKPNNLLEEAPVLFERQGLEDLTIGPDGELYAACGRSILRFAPDGSSSSLTEFDRDVTALAFCADGTLAVGLGNAVILDAGSKSARTIENCEGRALNAVNALHVCADGTLLISDGSATRPYSQWSHDLLEKGSTGRLLAYDPRSDKVTGLASNLGYCYGVFADQQGRAFGSESWRHQLTGVDGGRKGAVVVGGLPGYPARMAAAQGGGFWLSIFACRTQLVEFVLVEDDYRKDMMRSIEPRYWVAPALASGTDFLEPLQGGSVKQMGILKPWAPPRSYGLVVRIGDDFIPKYSLHSRVGGRHHGIIAVAQRGDDLYVLSKGAGRILRLSASAASEGRLV